MENVLKLVPVSSPLLAGAKHRVADGHPAISRLLAKRQANLRLVRNAACAGIMVGFSRKLSARVSTPE